MLSVDFGVLPAMGAFTPLFVDPLGNLGQIILPAMTLGLAFAASVTRISRSAMLDVLSDDYVRTARSKGASARSVVWRHALPNALIPVVTLSGVEFGYLLGGAVIVEQIYALPGLGRLVLEAILAARLCAGAGSGAVHRLQLPDRQSSGRSRLCGARSAHPAGKPMMGFLRAIFAHPSGRIGGVIVAAYLLVAILGALGLTPYDPLKQFRIDRLKPPTVTYWMGTDLFGRDVASRLMLGIGQSFTRRLLLGRDRDGCRHGDRPVRRMVRQALGWRS